MIDERLGSYRWWLLGGSALTLASALGGGLVSLATLAGYRFAVNISWLLPIAGLHLRLGMMSALFDLLTSMIALAVAGYMSTYFWRHSVPRLTLVLVPCFVIAMLLVPMAATYFDFWFFWETMALTSAVLVLAEYRNPSVQAAGLYYIAYTQLGFALILASTVSLNARSASGMLNVSAGHLLPISSLSFVLSLLGFASKAGLLPLSSWLPLAHPAAPTPVSVLMSASMVNLGIYGIVRVDLLVPGQSWWAILMIVIGLSTATYGALHALVSADIKRLLAFSTSENLGIIVTSLGVYELLRSMHFVALAEVALAAAILQLIGHALFKALAFVTAGRLADDAGSRNIDQMGDMIHRSPLAAAGFGVASLGATGLPLGAGFIGEWLLLQALIHTPPTAPILLRVVMPIAVALVALTIGLKVAAMTKSFGIGVLSRRRTLDERPAQRSRVVVVVDAVVVVALVVANLLFGVLPSVAAPLYRRVAQALLPHRAPVHIGVFVTLVPLRGGMSPLAIFIEVACLTVGVGIVVEGRIRANGRLVGADLWNCGGGEPRVRMQYNSASFAQPLETIFASALQLRERTAAGHSDTDRLIVATVSYERSRSDVVSSALHRVVARGVGQSARLIRRAHPGNIRLYVLYGAIGFLIILLVAR